MSVTVIKFIRNATQTKWHICNFENPAQTEEMGKASTTIYPGEGWPCSIQIPQTRADYQFSGNVGDSHTIGIWTAQSGADLAVRQFAVWQLGDNIWYSKEELNGKWSSKGTLAPGKSAVGGDRSVEIVGTDRFDADLRFY